MRLGWGWTNHTTNNNQNYTIHWRKVRNYESYTRESQKCKLCLGEKLEICNLNFKRALNKKSEIFKACPHKYKHYLSSFDPDFQEEELIFSQDSYNDAGPSNQDDQGQLNFQRGPISVHNSNQPIDQYQNLRKSSRLKTKENILKA